MARKQKPEECKQKVAEYMLTYGDMMTLLLCFFVLLFSFSSIDAKKFEAIMESFSGALGVLDGGTTIQDSPVIDSGLDDINISSEVLEMENFENLEKKIQSYLEENNLTEDVSILNEDAGLLLRFQDNIIFDTGSDQMKDQALNIISYIAQLLKAEEFKDKFISIEGHTDNIPVSSSRFPSNWELSVARSSNVVRFLVQQSDIDPQRISAAGYSEYHPVSDNTTAEGRAKNRRVDIMILKTLHYKNTAQN